MTNGTVKNVSNGTDNNPGNKGAGSPRIQGNWTVKHNSKMTSVNRRAMSPK